MGFATLKIALRALKRNFLRSILTMLGIIIGVAAVISGVSLGTGAKAQVEKSVASLGQNIITIFSGNMSRGGFGRGFGSTPNLTRDDYEALRREVTGMAGISPEVRSFSTVAFGSQNQQTQILGVGEDYVLARSWPFRSGQNFTANDVRGANKICLMGTTTAKTLFGEGADPVGQIVRIKGGPFLVAGLLESKGANTFGSDQDDVVLVPWTSAQKRLTGDTMFRSFTVSAEEATGMTDVQNQIGEVLRQRHKIGPGKDDDFTARTQQELADFATSTSRVMTIVIAAIAGISLLVGGIGIMNIMLVSVTERTREIGIRLAVGGRGSDVMWQFLAEAILLSLTGGALGIAFGLWASKLITELSEFPTLVSPTSIVIAFSVSAAIGIVFGFFPALKAARLDPIEALRYE